MWLPRSGGCCVGCVGANCLREVPLETSLPYSSLSALQRDGCPKIINLGAARTDRFYERKKYGAKG